MLIFLMIMQLVLQKLVKLPQAVQYVFPSIYMIMLLKKLFSLHIIQIGRMFYIKMLLFSGIIFLFQAAVITPDIL